MIYYVKLPKGKKDVKNQNLATSQPLNNILGLNKQ